MVVEVLGVEDRAVQALAGVGAEEEFEVEFGGAVGQACHFGRVVGAEVEGGCFSCFEGEADLEEGVAGEGAGGVEGVEDEVEGCVLVGEGVEVGGADVLEEFAEGGVVVGVGA